MRALTFSRTIGSGAFGTVYLAELSSGQGFRRQVAVKVLHGHRPDSEMFLTRIRDEARLLGLLRDDAILKVLDMVRVGGRDGVVMEYVEGIDLDSLIDSHQGPPPRGLAELGSAVAGGLARAHGAVHPATGQPLNVIHRDVKPANIMVTRAGGVKLLDFGVARARFDARESQTGQLVLGTLNYMAPEYIVTGEVTTAADVYGLGLSLWQVAAGEIFGQPKVRQDAHERRVATRLEQLQGTHDELLPLLARMLAWDPRERPTAVEVENQLLDAADALSGASLRSWARRVVPAALNRRGEVEDSAGLVGQTHDLQVISGDSDAEARLDALDEEGYGADASLVPPSPDAPYAAPPQEPPSTGVQHPPSTPVQHPPSTPVQHPPSTRVESRNPLDNGRETRQSVSTSRAAPALASASPAVATPPANRPQPPSHSTPQRSTTSSVSVANSSAANSGASDGSQTRGGSSPIPMGMIIVGAIAGIGLGLLVVAVAAVLLVLR
jgi:eukaryotic-like serine/threonine-protein kinase